MKGNPSNPTYRRSRAAYRKLLGLLPPELRRSHLEEFDQLLLAHLRAAHDSFVARCFVWLRALADLARHLVPLRRLVRTSRVRLSPPQAEPMTRPFTLLIEATVRDARFAARLLRKNWTFTVAATLILGLAIGANTAVFSLVDGVLLRPLPFPEPERLALVMRVFEQGGTGDSHDGATWLAIANASGNGIQSAVYSGWTTDVNLALGDVAVNVRQQRIGAGFFAVLGVAPMLGREFTAEEQVPGGPPVTVLSYAIWRRLFPADPDPIGQRVLLRGEPYTVVGVMPANFHTSSEADLWVPLRPSTTGEGSGTNYSIVLRVLEPTTWAQAAARIEATGRALLDSGSEGPGFAGLSIVPLQQGETAAARRSLTLLSLAVGAVLLVACTNVSGLLLVRADRRRHEIGTRMAIGGGRAAVVRQLLVESLLLAGGGGLAGVLIARGLLTAMDQLGREILGAWRPVAIDARVLLATGGVCLVTAFLFGLAPAVHASRVEIHDALRASGGRWNAGRRHWTRHLVVLAEVSLTVVLLVAAGLLLRSFLHLKSLDPGFDPRGVVAVSVSLQDARYATRDKVQGLLESGVERLRQRPRVVSAAAALGVPYQRLLNIGFRPLDFDLAEGVSPISNLVYVTPGYFETLAVPIRHGRAIDVSDNPDSERVAVVNEAFVHAYLPAGHALGHSLATANAPRRIVGVSGNVKQRASWGAPDPVAEVPTIYVPLSQVDDAFLRLVHTWFMPAWVARVSGPTSSAIPAIERTLAGLDPLLPLAMTRRLDQIRADAIARQRWSAWTVGALAGATILLATFGIYGLVAAAVSERKREIGIRLALGARAQHAVAAATVPGLRIVAAGVAVGLAASVAVARALRAMIWGVSPSDPTTYLAVCATLLLVACLASLLPARRAARLDPARTLRDE